MAPCHRLHPTCYDWRDWWWDRWRICRVFLRPGAQWFWASVSLISMLHSVVHFLAGCSSALVLFTVMARPIMAARGRRKWHCVIAYDWRD